MIGFKTMKTQPINHQKQPYNDQITESITIPFDPNSFISLRHNLNTDTPLSQKYDNPCHNFNIGVCSDVKNDSSQVQDIGLFSVPPDHPTFEANRHIFSLGVCAPAKYDDPIWESVSKKKTKGSPEEIEEKEMLDALGDEKLYIGFDTEYKNLKEVIDQKEEDSKKNLYLSYQFTARWRGQTWENVGFPKENHRLSMVEFICWVLSECPLFKDDPNLKLPQSIFLVCHYSRADLPSFREFFEKKSRSNFVNLRRTIVTSNQGAPIKLPIIFRGQMSLVKVGIRDTYLLAPSTAKSLDALGQLIGSHKLSLSDDDFKNMDVLRREDLQRFKDYAQMDSRIALEFSERIADLSTSFGKGRYIPTTLTSLGVVFLKQLWKYNGFDELKIIGKEKISETFRDRTTGKIRKKITRVSNTQRHLFSALATECYHGGRNEQYFFGAGVVGEWKDYDLPNAYPTGMSQLGTPVWEGLKITTDLEELSRHRLSYAQVEFKHPEGVRFPVLPVRGENSVLFPMEGISFCCGPEILLARSLGVEMKVLMGVIIPENEDKPFGKYLKHCFEKRDEAKKQGNDVLNQLWKELANSMYGKLAQGLRRRTIYNIKKGESEALDESCITTPFYAAFTTSFCRAVLGEILNKLPHSVSVCSCTTDGFLSNASDEEMKVATSGILSQQYLEAHRYFNPEKQWILEAKAEIQQPLGWRTRGQATLLPVDLEENVSSGKSFVLAKAGLTADAKDEIGQNKWIVEKFENRVFGEKYPVKSFVSVRDMFEEESDLYWVKSLITMSMDFDWKRRVDYNSLSLRKVSTTDHVFFDTLPWKTAQESEDCKLYWSDFSKSNGVCLKTIENVQSFRSFVECQKIMVKRQGRNNPRKGNVPMKMFRSWFARAYVNGAYGLPSPDTRRPSYRFLDLFFAERGLEGMRAALSNSRHNPVDPPNMIPPSPDVVRLVEDIQRLIPSFDETKVFIPSSASVIGE
jgi:hypothetical protein